MHPSVSNGWGDVLRLVPETLQLTIDKLCSCWNADGLPQLPGNVPVRLLNPSCSVVRAGKEALLAQDAGKAPVSWVSTSDSKDSDAKPPGMPHSSGRVPACTCHKLHTNDSSNVHAFRFLISEVHTRQVLSVQSNLF